MKYIVILLASASLIGCTTGSKTKTNINYYSNVCAYTATQQPEQPEVRYVEVPVEVVRERRVIQYRPSRELGVSDLGAEIGRKMLRKMRAAYNEN